MLVGRLFTDHRGSPGGGGKSGRAVRLDRDDECAAIARALEVYSPGTPDWRLGKGIVGCGPDWPEPAAGGDTIMPYLDAWYADASDWANAPGSDGSEGVRLVADPAAHGGARPAALAIRDAVRGHHRTRLGGRYGRAGRAQSVARIRPLAPHRGARVAAPPWATEAAGPAAEEAGRSAGESSSRATMIEIQSDGPRLVSTTYWQTQHARRGMVERYWRGGR